MKRIPVTWHYPEGAKQFCDPCKAVSCSVPRA